MSFRWLQFWGDLRQGLHPSWLGALETAAGEAPAPWACHHQESALAQRHKLGVAARWEADFKPDEAKWVMLESASFARWCQAVGLLSLGDHLKKILSVRSAERLRLSLDRSTLAAIMQFTNTHRAQPSAPLPLHLPTAEALGTQALGVVLSQQFPQVWSRVRLRMDQGLGNARCAGDKLVQVPDLATLHAFDAALFDTTARQRTPRINEATESWTETRTLSA